MAKSEEYAVNGVQFTIVVHRDANGHFATWKCFTCKTTGGKTGIYSVAAEAIDAAKEFIKGHCRNRHPQETLP